MADPRVAPVEDNLLDFVEAFTRLPLFTREPDTDVVVCRSDVAFPMFNTVTGARFGEGTEAARAAAVVGRMRSAGLPFLWWTTPSTTSEALEETLLASGLVREDTFGMYRELGAPLEPRVPAGVELLTVDVSREAQPFVDTMLAAFGMPEWLAAPFEELSRGLPPERFLNVLATVGGQPVATGTAWLTGPVVGLYNIATREDHRGRGLGAAVTARLAELARERGAVTAVLHATEVGRPVYAGLGFADVCPLPQYLWEPASEDGLEGDTLRTGV